MTEYAYQVSSAAAARDARPATSGVSSWQSCLAAVSTVQANPAIRMRKHGNGFLTARRPKERSEP
jgi:hypothetical protein